MSIPFRALFALALAYLAFVFLREAQALHAKPDADGTRVVLMFMGVVFTGLIAAGLVATAILPQLGEGIGNFFFNPNEKLEDHPHTVAITAVARGDYQRAVDEYRKVTHKNPEDTLAYSEAARVLCEKMHQCEEGAALLEHALDRDWAPEDAAFLSLRLADVYWHHTHDLSRARELLLQIMEQVPDSKQAATAAHKLHELDRKMMMEG
jgi:tetratricopeptide (TPR) repeat protein